MMEEKSYPFKNNNICFFEYLLFNSNNNNNKLIFNKYKLLKNYFRL